MLRDEEASTDAQPSCTKHVRYVVTGTLGRGSFGEVLKATDTVTGDEVALKRIFLKAPHDCMPANVMREYKALQLLQSPHIVRLLDAFAMDQHVVCAMELCHCDLHTVLAQHDAPLPAAIIKRLALDLFRGVHAIHNAGMIHRDLKPSNLMVDGSGALKIADFGLCRPVVPPGRAYSATAPTKSYRAPELLFGARVYDGCALDMWSVGCILAELHRKAPLFRAEGELQQLSCIMAVLGSYSPGEWGGELLLPDYGKVVFPPRERQPLANIVPGASEAAVALLEGLLSYDPGARPTAAAALQSAWFWEWPRPAADEAVAEFVQKYEHQAVVQGDGGAQGMLHSDLCGF